MDPWSERGSGCVGGSEGAFALPEACKTRQGKGAAVTTERPTTDAESAGVAAMVGAGSLFLALADLAEPLPLRDDRAEGREDLPAPEPFA